MRGHERLLKVTLSLRRRAIDRRALAQLLWHHPFMTHRVTTGIYAQAARLGMRGAPFHQHPSAAGRSALSFSNLPTSRTVLSQPERERSRGGLRENPDMAEVDGLLSRSQPRQVRALFDSAARRLALAAGSFGEGGAIEIVEAGGTHRLGAGDVAARVEVHATPGLTEHCSAPGR